VHEVSLMKNLLDTVEETARRESGEPVKVIHLRIGELSGVNIEALSFAFEVLKEGTLSSEARLEFERVSLEARCKRCGADFHPDELIFRCTKCGSADIEILAGREMHVDFILLDDEINKAGRNGSIERNE
jgi:hydrogenase nickel incorporation protein HypA/HybF